jgi:hypothetical protein
MTQRYVVALASALLFVGCSSSSDSSGTPAGTATLTVADFDSWCALSVTSPANTTLPSGASGASNAITLPVNTVITLHAEPNSGFTWATTAARGGGWSGTLDSGTDPLSKSINVTLGASKSIKVCCPFPDGSGCA